MRLDPRIISVYVTLKANENVTLLWLIISYGIIVYLLQSYEYASVT
jgi:hypothetical protein